MRIIVYGMQSSGASYFTYFLAQKTNYIGVIDLWSSELAPFFENNNVIETNKVEATPNLFNRK